ncbi:hypothetical protein ABPG74_008780 [Tetrahymena malaccensis]
MSWKHSYDDYFHGISIDDRDLHYSSDDANEQLKINFYIQNPNDTEEEDKFVSTMNFYVYKNKKEKYDPSINQNIVKLFEKQSLLITPIEELEQIVKEQRKAKAAQMEQELLQETMEEDKQLIKKEHLKDRQLWVDKYMPKRYDELLSFDKINREVMCWLKAWDPIVFKKKLKKNIYQNQYNNQYHHNQSFGRNVFGQVQKVNSIYNNNQFNKKEDETNQNKGFQGGDQNKQFQGNNKFQYAGQKPFYFDLSDDYSVQKMQNSVILLAGPPGSGKTTLARTVARQCGYKIIEINASEERTAAKLIEKIETVTRNEALKFKNDNKAEAQKEKPSLIIVDEVDGAMESESHGAVNHLLDFIFKGQKNIQKKGAGETQAKQTNQAAKKKPESKKKKKKDEDDEDGDDDNQNDGDDEKGLEEETSKQTAQNVHIRRPVIFICNDMYSKGLRELRKKAFVFNFTKAKSDKLLQRLKEICHKEKLNIDQSGLQKICDHNENDIRSTLMNLQMISKIQKQNNRQKISIDQILMEEKNNSKSILELLECIMMPPLQKKDSKVDILRYTIHTLIKNTQPDQLIEATLLNYSKIKNTERYFDKIPQFLDDLSLAEILESNLLKHNYEMTKFISLPIINFGLNLKGQERVKLDFPRDNFTLKRRYKAAIDCIESLLENLPNSDAPYLNNKNFVLDYISNIYQIIQPNISSNIISDDEKKDLYTSLSIMIDFSLKLLDNPFKIDRNGQKFNIYFTPQIERMLLFGNDVPVQRLNERSIHFILKNYDIISHQKALARDMADDEIQQKKLEEKLMNIEMLDNQYNKKANKRKKRIEGEEASFLYKFREGVSIPIKYDVKMSQLFN